MRSGFRLREPIFAAGTVQAILPAIALTIHRPERGRGNACNSRPPSCRCDTFRCPLQHNQNRQFRTNSSMISRARGGALRARPSRGLTVVAREAVSIRGLSDRGEYRRAARWCVARFSSPPYILFSSMKTAWDDKVTLFLIGQPRVTLDQVCSGVGIKFPSAHQHQEIARAMENAGWHHAAGRHGCVIFWEAGPKSLNQSPGTSGLLEIPEA
jgi:hypothetical protein